MNDHHQTRPFAEVWREFLDEMRVLRSPVSRLETNRDRARRILDRHGRAQPRAKEEEK